MCPLLFFILFTICIIIKKYTSLFRALHLGCINAEHPDSYKHYREAKFTQTKHHWWWKANRLFDQLNITRNHTGMVLFLEEDHYVAEDFLHVLKLLEYTCLRREQLCDVLSLGTYVKTYNYYANSKKVLLFIIAQQIIIIFFYLFLLFKF